MHYRQHGETIGGVESSGNPQCNVKCEICYCLEHCICLGRGGCDRADSSTLVGLWFSVNPFFRRGEVRGREFELFAVLCC